MKFQELEKAERENIKKYIKEELRPSQSMKNVVEIANPNQFDYESQGGIKLKGRLVNMNDSQIEGAVIRNVKDKLKKAI